MVNLLKIMESNVQKNTKLHQDFFLLILLVKSQVEITYCVVLCEYYCQGDLQPFQPQQKIVATAEAEVERRKWPGQQPRQWSQRVSQAQCCQPRPPRTRPWAANWAERNLPEHKCVPRVNPPKRCNQKREKIFLVQPKAFC